MLTINLKLLSFLDNTPATMVHKPYICGSMRNVLFQFLLALIFCCSGYGQSIRDTAKFRTQLSISYAIQLPEGDLKQRFGWNSNLGLFLDFKLKSNWVIGLNSQFIFGNQIKDTSMLSDMLTSDGQIINQNGNYARVQAYERGWNFSGNFGRVFSVIGPNPNSGILVKLGIGFMQHKVRIDAEQNLVPQFTGDYKKLYDRYTNGISFTQFLGYSHMSSSRLANFFGGFEFTQGITKGRRERQAGGPTDLQDDRIDLLMGIRVGWIVPLYKRAPRDFYLD